MTKYDWGQADELIKILREANQDVPKKLEDMADRFKAKKERDGEERRQFGGGNRGGGRGFDGGNRRDRW